MCRRKEGCREQEPGALQDFQEGLELRLEGTEERWGECMQMILEVGPGERTRNCDGTALGSHASVAFPDSSSHSAEARPVDLCWEFGLSQCGAFSYAWSADSVLEGRWRPRLRVPVGQVGTWTATKGQRTPRPCSAAAGKRWIGVWVKGARPAWRRRYGDSSQISETKKSLPVPEPALWTADGRFQEGCTIVLLWRNFHEQGSSRGLAATTAVSTLPDTLSMFYF